MSRVLSLLLALSTYCAAQDFENTQETTLMWTLISSSQNMQLHGFIVEHPSVVHLRSEDGRGALWWAWEYKNAEALAVLAANGVDLNDAATDSEGLRASELCDDYDAVLAEAQSLVETKKVERERIQQQIVEEKEKMLKAEQEAMESDDDDMDDLEDDEDFGDDGNGDDDDDDDFFRDEL